MPTRNNKKNRNSRKNRKTCRKNRKSYRKNRKSYRKNKKQYGGNMAQSLGQGRQYMEYHKNQHGGAYLTGAPVSQIDGSMLESGLRDFARIGGLDASIAAARAQGPDQDVPMPQKGGRRTGRKNKGRKASKKSKKNRKASKKNRKASKKSKKSRSRRQAGGALTGAPINAPTMLISQAAAARAGTADFSNALLKD